MFYELEKLGKPIINRKNKSIYKKDGSIIKIFHHNVVDKSNVLFEAYNHSLVENIIDYAPKLTEVFPMSNGDWAIVYDYVEGTTLQEKMDKDPEHVEQYIDELVNLQLKVLSTQAPELGKLKDKLNAKISFLGKQQSVINVPATVRYDLHIRLENMPNHNKLCHMDFVPSNIVCKNDGTYIILDWAHAARGNASCDAANTYLKLMLEGQEKAAKIYLRVFCEKADVALQYVQRWISVVSATLINSIEAEEQREYLLRNVNVVESM